MYVLAQTPNGMTIEYFHPFATTADILSLTALYRKRGLRVVEMRPATVVI